MFNVTENKCTFAKSGIGHIMFQCSRLLKEHHDDGTILDKYWARMLQYAGRDDPVSSIYTPTMSLHHALYQVALHGDRMRPVHWANKMTSKFTKSGITSVEKLLVSVRDGSINARIVHVGKDKPLKKWTLFEIRLY